MPSISRSNSFTGLVGEMMDSSIRSLNASMRSLKGGRRRTSSKTSSMVSLSSTALISGLSPTEFSLEDFEEFVDRELLALELDSEVLEDLKECLGDDDADLRETFQVIETGLLSLLASHNCTDNDIDRSECEPESPPELVGEIYSYLGLVYLEEENHEAAVDAFTKAIKFLRMRTNADTPGDSDDSDETLAKAHHRLGVAHGRNQRYEQAMEELDRAIAGYDEGSGLCGVAKEDHHQFKEAHLLAELAKTRPQDIVRDEEPEDKQSRRESRRASRRRRSKSPNTNICPGICRAPATSEDDEEADVTTEKAKRRASRRRSKSPNKILVPALIRNGSCNSLFSMASSRDATDVATDSETEKPTEAEKPATEERTRRSSRRQRSKSPNRSIMPGLMRSGTK